MLKFIDHRKMGRNREPNWLDSYFHFSFADYYKESNIQFGVLRVLNDDTVKPHAGFVPHPHRDMEIISYVVDGELTHEDSMGNKSTLIRGQVQYMSAGTHVVHSEMNYTNKPLRWMQIWFFPDKTGYQPNYGEQRFQWEDRINKWLPLVTSYGNKKSTAPIKIHADINMYATYLTRNKTIKFETNKKRQTYLVLIEGKATINKIKLVPRDAIEIREEDVIIQTSNFAHIIVLEMALKY